MLVRRLVAFEVVGQSREVGVDGGRVVAALFGREVAADDLDALGHRASLSREAGGWALFRNRRARPSPSPKEPRDAQLLLGRLREAAGVAGFLGARVHDRRTQFGVRVAEVLQHPPGVRLQGRAELREGIAEVLAALPD